MRLNRKNIGWLLFLAFLYICYLPNEILVDMKGDPKGFVNQIRAVWGQGKFWAKQADLIDKRIEYLESLPRRQKEIDRQQAQIDIETEKTLRDVNAMVEEIFSEMPEDIHQQVMPSPEEKLAKKLRREADRVEYQDFLNKREKWRQNELRNMCSLLSIVQGRYYHKSKSSP